VAASNRKSEKPICVGLRDDALVGPVIGGARSLLLHQRITPVLRAPRYEAANEAGA